MSSLSLKEMLFGPGEGEGKGRQGEGKGREGTKGWVTEGKMMDVVGGDGL